MCVLNPKTTSHLPCDLFLLTRQNEGFQIPFFLSTEEEAAKVRPPAVVKTLEARLEELSPKQQETLRDFKEIVKSAPWYNENEHDDWLLIRYLIARNFDKKKSFAMLEKSVRWRKEKDVDNWVCEVCLENPNKHLMQFVGWDLQSRPVCFMAMRWGPERKHPLKHCVNAFNHLVRLMPVGVEQWVCVTDFETFSYVKDSHPKMALSVVQTIQDHFPERLGLMILVNPPKMFAVLWSALSPAIEEKTRAKVMLLYTKVKPNIQTGFAKIFPTALAEYLCESYRRSEANVLPTTPVWYPVQGKE
ncbi:cellular retinaldehyde-binding protein/triple function domain-containing protein [Trypanosoma rangeli]|uniref:Cellular retinaldehyde-binding protein/triple function domain-containing protein n=1 Tax=Trypanosoma rangeli TaxID=5698 RepID=A0A3R7L5B2_TRYRA|nr:cellular retinaldehyde-binding protein/triple function domain-containing protein [Trypanosoma rangeli]RNF07930.1 cellular retinaldehyde-binding protein/triple function domain-containing protein [Trypanosoma rangeli]|eukprot:RNF07930.1 cellular retinaldehyde-binding protein/triple function domain-containing protein [Trypanosoma rangeli]